MSCRYVLLIYFMMLQVSQFFQKIVSVTNDIIQIALSLAKMAVTGEIGDIGKYEKDLMLRTTGTTDPGKHLMTLKGGLLGYPEYCQLLATHYSEFFCCILDQDSWYLKLSKIFSKTFQKESSLLRTGCTYFKSES